MTEAVEKVLAALVDGLKNGTDNHGSTPYFGKSQPLDDEGEFIASHDFYCVDGEIDLRKVAEKIVKALG